MRENEPLDAELVAAIDPRLPAERTVKVVECKRHPGAAVDTGDVYCRHCGIYNGVVENFQVTTYRMVPVEVRQAQRRDLE